MTIYPVTKCDEYGCTRKVTGPAILRAAKPALARAETSSEPLRRIVLDSDGHRIEGVCHAPDAVKRLCPKPFSVEAHGETVRPVPGTIVRRTCLKNRDSRRQPLGMRQHS